MDRSAHKMEMTWHCGNAATVLDNDDDDLWLDVFVFDAVTNDHLELTNHRRDIDVVVVGGGGSSRSTFYVECCYHLPFDNNKRPSWWLTRYDEYQVRRWSHPAWEMPQFGTCLAILPCLKQCQSYTTCLEINHLPSHDLTSVQLSRRRPLLRRPASHFFVENDASLADRKKESLRTFACVLLLLRVCIMTQRLLMLRIMGLIF
jgi:hypothetical protein